MNEDLTSCKERRIRSRSYIEYLRNAHPSRRNTTRLATSLFSTLTQANALHQPWPSFTLPVIDDWKAQHLVMYRPILLDTSATSRSAKRMGRDNIRWLIIVLEVDQIRLASRRKPVGDPLVGGTIERGDSVCVAWR